MLPNDYCEIYYFKCSLDRPIDDELNNYLKNYLDRSYHVEINVEKYKKITPDWIKDSFFGCTGKKGELLLTNRHSFIDLLRIGLTNEHPIMGLVNGFPLFTIEDKRYLKLQQEYRAYCDIITWLQFIIDNFFETAPDPYFLNGLVRVKSRDEKAYIQIINNNILKIK